jgi:2C-methyl-D-erythritol 2,4-cyclodiphosphate synthase
MPCASDARRAPLGDIGQHFPPSDDRWKGADSSDFVRHCDGLLRERAGASATPTSL